MATLQVTTYSLRVGVSDESFIAADAVLQEWTYLNVPGIARRTTARGRDGNWITIRLYEDASSSGTHWFDSPDDAVVEWRAMVEESSIDSCDYELL